MYSEYQSSKVFDSAYRENRASVRRFVASQLGRDRAEDVTQEVWAAFWRSLNRGNRINNPRGWLIKTAKGAVRYALRKRRLEQLHEGTAEGLPSGEREPVENVVGAEQFALVHDYVSQESGAKRDFLEAVFFDGATFREAASSTGVPRATGLDWVNRARRDLAVTLE